MSNQRTLWIMRHGLREDSHPVKWCESLKHMVDPDLQPLGMEMARRLAVRLTGEPIDHLFTSPFLRTLRTTQYLADMSGKPMNVEYGFHEMLDPKWFPDGIPTLPTLQERAREFPSIDKDYRSFAFPESMEGSGDFFGRRVNKAITAILAAIPGNLAIVSHYAVCNCLHKILTGDYVQGYIELTSISKYVQNGDGWTVECVADASHIHGMLEEAAALAAAG